MGTSNFFNVILGVLLDWRVIATVVAMLLVIEFAKFVANYKKRPPRPKVKKSKTAPAPKPKKEKKSEEEEGDEGGNASEKAK